MDVKCTTARVREEKGTKRYGRVREFVRKRAREKTEVSFLSEFEPSFRIRTRTVRVRVTSLLRMRFSNFDDHDCASVECTLKPRTSGTRTSVRVKCARTPNIRERTIESTVDGCVFVYLALALQIRQCPDQLALGSVRFDLFSRQLMGSDLSMMTSDLIVISLIVEF